MTILANPPADGSDRKYSLVRIVKDTKVKDLEDILVDAKRHVRE